jgi:hypothetical protein
MSDLNGYVLEMLLDLGPFEILVKPFNLGGCRLTKIVTTSRLAAESVGWMEFSAVLLLCQKKTSPDAKGIISVARHPFRFC